MDGSGEVEGRGRGSVCLVFDGPSINFGPASKVGGEIYLHNCLPKSRNLEVDDLLN